MQLVLNLARTVLSDKRQAEDECRAVCQLLTCVLHNSPPPALDSTALPAIVDLVLLRFADTTTAGAAVTGITTVAVTPLHLALAETLASCFHYSAGLTFAALESRGATQAVLMNVSASLMMHASCNLA
jgi:hypothetical protein